MAFEMSIRFREKDFDKRFAEAMVEKHRPVATAATKAMGAVKDDVIVWARQEIASAGFPSRKPQNAFRGKAFPSGGKVSLEPAAFFWSKIPYFGVFEEGAIIAGKPEMWVPMPDNPASRRRLVLLNMREFMRDIYKIGRKGFVRRIRSTRYFMAPMRVPAGVDPARHGKGLAELRKGQRPLPKRRRGRVAYEIAYVPLFVAKKTVTIRKRIDVASVAVRGRERLAQYYGRFFEDE